MTFTVYQEIKPKGITTQMAFFTSCKPTLIIAAFVSIMAAMWLAWASLHYGEVPLWLFSVAMLSGFIATLLAFPHINRAHLLPVFIVSMVLHVAGVIGQPVLEDDHYRFLWDGYQFATSGTPYGKVPEAAFDDTRLPDAFQDVLDQVNYPEHPTIYGPVNQYIFLLAYWLKPASISALQGILAIINLCFIGLLLRIASTRYVMLYAWSPLVTKEIAFTAHIDGVGAAALFTAVWLFHRRHLTRASLVLALAIGVKVFAWLLVPFLLWRQPMRVWLLFISGLLLLYLPFAITGSSDLNGLLVFAQYWQFNPALFGILSQWFSPLATKVGLALCFCGWLLYYWLRYQQSTTDYPVSDIPRGERIFGLFLLISPVINAWYVLWLLPFAVIQKTIWPWITSVALLMSYFTWLNLENYSQEPFGLPLTISLVQFGMIGAAVAYDARKRRL